jgi:tripeptide aminopeptidase
VLNTLTRAIEAENHGSADLLHLHVERIGNRPAGALAPSSALSQSLRAVDRHLNLATESRIGSTDANLPLSLGIPALAIGAGGTGWGIHTLQEGYDPTGRELALRRILLLLLDACAVAVDSNA